MTRLHPTRPRGDEGDVVMSWLVKLVIGIGGIGILLFDVLSVATARLGVEDQAVLSARLAAQAWSGTGDIQAAYDAALTSAREANELNEILVDDFVVDPDGTAHLTVRREATTLLVFRLEQTRGWAVVTADADGTDLD